MQDEVQRRLDEKLIWYSNGSLDAEDRALVIDYAKQHPDAEAEIQYLETVREALRGTAPQRAADAGLDKFMQRLHGARGRAANIGLRARLAAMLRELATPRLGLSVAGLLIVVQAGVIGVMLGERRALQADAPAGAAMTRSLEAATPVAPYLKVRFKPAATAREIDQLLLDVDGGIVAGPMQGGFYAIRLREGDLARAASQVGARSFVDDVIAVESSSTGRR